MTGLMGVLMGRRCSTSTGAWVGLRSVLRAGAWFALCIGAGFAGVAAAASPDEPVQPLSTAFQNQDWELRCDNAGTCRAAGYETDSNIAHPVSMRLERAAGPGAPVRMTVQVGDESPAEGRLRIAADDVVVDGLRPGVAHVSAADARRLLPALLRSTVADVSTRNSRWTLSLAGLNAVLLKMDDVQGRLDTPGALMRPGNLRPESAVPGPRALPIVDNILPAADIPGDAALVPLVFASLDLAATRQRCNGGDALSVTDLRIHRLAPHRLLASIRCGIGAYNEKTFHWLVDDAPPFASQAINADGVFDPADGSLRSAMRGRGLGDCIDTTVWHFTPAGFVKTAISGDFMCRGFAGGAWDLPTYVTRLAHLQGARTPSLSK